MIFSSLPETLREIVCSTPTSLPTQFTPYFTPASLLLHSLRTSTHTCVLYLYFAPYFTPTSLLHTSVGSSNCHADIFVVGPCFHDPVCFASCLPDCAGSSAVIVRNLCSCFFLRRLKRSCMEDLYKTECGSPLVGWQPRHSNSSSRICSKTGGRTLCKQQSCNQLLSPRCSQNSGETAARKNVQNLGNSHSMGSGSTGDK